MRGVFGGRGVLVLATALTPAVSLAGGFSLNEQSASAMGTANAGAAANPENATTVYFNPAGMSQLSGTNLSFGASVLDINAEADQARATNQVGQPVPGSNGGDIADPTVLPNVYMTHEVNNRVDVGFGIHAPYGLAADYENDFKGRYFADKTELTGVAFSPAISVDTGEGLSMGASLNILYVEGRLTKFQDLSGALAANPNVSDAQATAAAEGMTAPYSDVEGDDIGYTFRLGALYELSDRTQFGFSAQTGTEVKLKGDVTVSDFPVIKGGSIVGTTTLKEDVSVPLDIPPSVTFGARHQLTDSVTLLAGATWASWSDFQELDVNPDEANGPVSGSSDAPITHVTEKWEDTWQYNIGAIWQATPEWAFKTGYAWDESPVNEYKTARVPSQDRHWLTLGAQWDDADSGWTVDAAVGTLIFDGDARVNEFEYLHSAPQTQDPSAGASNYQGTYDLSAWSASVQVSRAF